MQCREDCAACCIAPSINAPLPNMPEGKPASVTCYNLDLNTLKCRIWQQPNYPVLCARFQAEHAFCGDNREQALTILHSLESDTQPTKSQADVIAKKAKRVAPPF